MSDEKRKVRVSLGSAAALGLQHVRTDAPATTAYLLSGEVCARNCAFCPQAREAKGGRNRLSRVTWPEFDLDAVTGALSAPAVKRVCLQTVDHPQEKDRLKDEIRVLAGSAAPLCVAANVRTVEEVGELLALGVDKVGIAVDAATSEIFRKIKGGSFAQVTSLLEAAARAYPGHVSTHLIIGLGETEKEAVEFLAWCRDRGITAGLFALTPIPGTELAKAEPPRLVQYRRVQAAHYLLFNHAWPLERFGFNTAGEVAGFGVSSKADMMSLLGGGRAFETSGCPDCNRPYYNERPGGVMYNYPRRLTPAEFEEALNLIWG